MTLLTLYANKFNSAEFYIYILQVQRNKKSQAIISLLEVKKNEIKVKLKLIKYLKVVYGRDNQKMVESRRGFIYKNPYCSGKTPKFWKLFPANVINLKLGHSYAKHTSVRKNNRGKKGHRK